MAAVDEEVACLARARFDDAQERRASGAGQAALTRQTTSTPLLCIYLSQVTNVQRIDLKPYCIELETKDKPYYLVRAGPCEYADASVAQG